MTLRLAEEITLLLLREEDGLFVQTSQLSLRCAYVGAVLMDLALEYRIDTDQDRLLVIDKTPTGNDVLDTVLTKIAWAGDIRDTRQWVDHLGGLATQIQQDTLAGLVTSGILRHEEDRFLWVFKSYRYRVVDGEIKRGLKERIEETLFGDEIPDPRDIVLVSLMHDCDILSVMFSLEELKRASDRIDQVRRMDLIGRAVSKAVWDIHSMIAHATHPTF